MTADEQRLYRARMSSLDEALGFVEAFCGANGVVRDDMLRLRLIVEELFTNSVEHGHGGDCDSPIAVALAAAADAVRLDYADEAAPFDPLQHLQAEGDAAAASPSARVGGLGLRLVTRLAASVDYAREDGRNRLRLVLVRQA